MQSEQQDGEQQRDAAGQHEQGVLDGGETPFRADAPQADQEIDRHQGQFPEQEEQHQIQGAEYAHGDAFQRQQQGEIQSGQGLDAGPGRQDHGAEQQRGQRREQGGNTVDPQQVVNVQAGNPHRPFHELHPGIFRAQRGQHQQRQGQFQNGAGQCPDPHGPMLTQERQHQRPDQRQQDQEAQNRDTDGRQGFVIKQHSCQAPGKSSGN